MEWYPLLYWVVKTIASALCEETKHENCQREEAAMESYYVGLLISVNVYVQERGLAVLKTIHRLA